MKKRRFSEGQIATALRQVDAGPPIPKVTRALEISEADVLCVAQAIWSDGHRRDSAVAAAGRSESQAEAVDGRSIPGYGNSPRGARKKP
mgnify:CR=1 FL=1